MRSPSTIGTTIFGITLLAIAVVVVIVGYRQAVLDFGWPPGTNLENSKLENWGVFGDFLGGSINPLLTFLTFIAVLATLFLQAQELKATRQEMSDNRKVAEQHVAHLKSEAYKSDIQKTILIIDDSLSKYFSRETTLKNFSLGKEKNYNVEEALVFLTKDLADSGFIENNLDIFEVDGTVEKFTVNYDNVEKITGRYKDTPLMIDFKKENAYVLNNIIADLESLNKFLFKYSNASEGFALVDYYIMKYREMSCLMVIINLASKEKLDFFLKTY